MSSLQGWGRGTWGQGAWNEPVNVEPTGVVGTTALGTPDGIPGVNVSVTGLSATTAISQTGVSTVTFVSEVTAPTFSGKNTRYTSGVTYNIDGSSVSQSSYVDTTTFNAGTTRYVEITVPDGAPTLHYQCYNHALMGYQASTLGIPNVATTTGAPV